jgi:hypothetical protein
MSASFICENPCNLPITRPFLRRSPGARFTFPAQPAITLLIRADSPASISGDDVTGFHVNRIGGLSSKIKICRTSPLQ